MADGTKKPIEKVEVGDKVIATDPETGEQEPRKVDEVFKHWDRMSDLVLEDGAVLTTTEDHPYWSVDDQRFERADQLGAGEKVLSADGQEIRVVGLRWGIEGEGWAYNLSVEGIHTYHVGEDEILVHNHCSKKLLANMELNGWVRLPGEDAHHIVPGGDKRADPARQVLENFKIDIDSAFNGVLLPKNGRPSTPNPRGATPHRGYTMTNAYMNSVNTLLRSARSATDVTRTLGYIRYELLAGRTL